MQCACADNESLRGAAVNAYIARFLARVAANEPNRYQCRVCGAQWERPAEPDNVRTQLIRVAPPAARQEE